MNVYLSRQMKQSRQDWKQLLSFHGSPPCLLWTRLFVHWMCDYIGFPIVNFPWLSGDVPRLPSYGIYISQLVRFSRCCTSVFDFHSKNHQITSKLLTQGNRYHKLRKRLETSLGHTLNCCWNLVIYLFRNMYLKESPTRSSMVILSTN